LIDRRMITNFDWLFFCTILALAGVGIINLYSAASSFAHAGAPVYVKQLYWFGLGALVMLPVALVDYHRLASLSLLLYIALILALIAVLYWGKVVGGSRRWLAFGPLVLQPSELARLSVVLVLAHYFHRHEQERPRTLRQLIIPFTLVLIPAFLILKQPDLGTALMVIIVGSSVILVNGVRWTSLALAGGGILAIVPVAWRFLQDYQKKRIFSFLNPESDPLGSSYHLIQSKIAVGSGQFWGKGFMQGTQSQLNFLPEQHTDFAFSVLAEEWGFIGGLVVVFLLGFLVYRGLYHAYRSKDKLGQLIVVGAVASFFWPAVINLGMVLGLFPVVGIPAPFLSYGGSSLVTTMLALGLVEAVSMHRFVFQTN
jgi:rod shape determining protein RodA